MSIKIIGAILIILGCGGFGFILAANCKYEEKNLRQLYAALNYMECEVRYRLTPLPELCRKAADCCNGYVCNVLQNLSTELEYHTYPNVRECISTVLARTRGFSPITQSILQKLGITLGHFDLEGQLKGIQCISEECKQRLEALNENQTVRLRSYQTLGLCAGAALTILFI